MKYSRFNNVQKTHVCMNVHSMIVSVHERDSVWMYLSMNVSLQFAWMYLCMNIPLHERTSAWTYLRITYPTKRLDPCMHAAGGWIRPKPYHLSEATPESGESGAKRSATDLCVGRACTWRRGLMFLTWSGAQAAGRLNTRTSLGPSGPLP